MVAIKTGLKIDLSIYCLQNLPQTNCEEEFPLAWGF